MNEANHDDDKVNDKVNDIDEEGDNICAEDGHSN